MAEKYFTYKNLDELRKGVRALRVDITFEEEPTSIRQPVKIGDRRIGNSLGIHPMEGCDGTSEGKPDELTFRRWKRFGRGGAKLIWGEATAVVPEGLANPRQLLLTEENLPAFDQLLKQTRAAHRDVFGRDDDLFVGLQITHSGRFAYRKPLIAYHHPQVDQVTYLNKKRGIRISPDYPLVSDDDLERLEDALVAATRRAYNIGFDFVDIKQCHTYLLNELLGARTREGPYGGSFENRTRFIRNVLGKIRSDMGDSIILASRINAFDGVPFCKDPQTGIGTPVPFITPYPYGFGVNQNNPLAEDLTEPIQLVKLLVESGVKIVNVSMGSPYYNMHIGRPFEHPPVDGYIAPEHPLVGVDRHFRVTEAIQKAFPNLVVVGTGYSWLRQFLINAGESNLRRKRVTIVATGRGAIAYPDYAADAIKLGRLKPSSVCIAVSHCTNLMRTRDNETGQYPAGCVPRDTVYANIFKEVRKKGRRN